MFSLHKDPNLKKNGKSSTAWIPFRGYLFVDVHSANNTHNRQMILIYLVINSKMIRCLIPE